MSTNIYIYRIMKTVKNQVFFQKKQEKMPLLYILLIGRDYVNSKIMKNEFSEYLIYL